MAWWILPRRIKQGDKVVDRWRLTAQDDMDDNMDPIDLCKCPLGHGSMAEAAECPDAVKRINNYSPLR